MIAAATHSVRGIERRHHRAFHFCLSIVALLPFAFDPTLLAQGLTVPRLIDHARLESLLEQIAASDAQAREISMSHSLYLQEWSKSFDEDITKMVAAWQSSYVPPETFAGQSMAAQFKEAKELADRLRFRLKGANDAFFDGVEFILADSQLTSMRRFRLGWERFCLKRSMQGIPEKGIDIVDFLQKVDLVDAERAMVDAYLLDQEPAYIAALKEAAEADERVAIVEFELLDVARPYMGKMVRPPEAERQVLALRAKAGKLGLRSWKRLVEMNRRILQQSTALLSPETAQAIRLSYATAAYPSVFPDATSAEFIFEGALALSTLEKPQSEALMALRDQYRAKHASLSAAMCASIFECEVLIHKGEATNQADAAVQRAETIRLGTERETWNLSQVNSINGFLSVEQQALLPIYHFRYGKPSRPWDPEAMAAERQAEHLEAARLMREQAATHPDTPETRPN